MKASILLAFAWLAGAFPTAATAQLSHSDVFGPRFKARAAAAADAPRLAPDTRPGVDPVERWNRIAIDASGLDHTPVGAGESRVFGEQIGPCRSARALAIVQIAVFEVVNAIHYNRYKSYVGLPPARKGASMGAGIAQAAHDTLVAMFPSQAPAFGTLLAEDLDTIRATGGKADGVALGKAAAAAILALRAADGSAHPEPRVGIEYIPGDQPGIWRQDPVSRVPLALGARWAEVAPFVMESAARFRLPPPPPLDSVECALAFVEVKRMGGDGVTTATERTEEESFIGTYWAYDGTPSLCAPPRLYNQIAVEIAKSKKSPQAELARLLALVNVAMADGAIAAWESKYHYAVWRPVTGVREADPGTGPTGAGDGCVDTVGDIAYSPLGAPASNLTGPNFTPPFPAYPSGHAVFGAVLFQTLRRFYGTDEIPFTFVSDEFNGVTEDSTGAIRPLRPRSFKNLTEAEIENAQSRIYLGIHWSFDASSGIAMGRNVADHLFGTLYSRVPRPHR